MPLIGFGNLTGTMLYLDLLASLASKLSSISSSIEHTANLSANAIIYPITMPMYLCSACDKC